MTMSFRPAAFGAILKRDIARLWPWAVPLGLGQLYNCAVLRIEDGGTTATTPHGGLMIFSVVLFLTVPVALSLFTVILAQQDVASDFRRDWLIRPIAASEIVSAKLTVLAAVIVLPTLLGHFIYGQRYDLSLAATFGTAWKVMTWYLFLFILAWLTRSFLQAVLALLVFCAVGIPFVIALIAISAFAPGPLSNWLTDAPGESARLNDALALAGLILVSWLSLWLLLDRRRLALARLAFGAWLLVICATNPSWFVMDLDPYMDQPRSARVPAEPPGAEEAQSMDSSMGRENRAAPIPADGPPP